MNVSSGSGTFKIASIKLQSTVIQQLITRFIGSPLSALRGINIGRGVKTMKVGAHRVRNNGAPGGCAPGVPAWLPRAASRERSADVPPTVRGPAPAPLDCGRGSADTLLTSPTSKKSRNILTSALMRTQWATPNTPQDTIRSRRKPSVTTASLCILLRNRYCTFLR